MASLGRKGASAALTSADIPDNSITAAKIVDGTITVGDIGTNAVGTDEIANDAVTGAKIENNPTIAGNLTVSGDLVPSTPLSHRNMIINGAMNVSQRRGTTAVQLSATEYYIVDRFTNDTGASFDMKADASQSSESPSGFASSLKLDCDGVSTATSSHNGGIATYLEGQDCQMLGYGTADAKDVTLSFYAKSASENNGHSYGVMLGAFLGGARSTQTKGFTVTTSWQRFEMTFSANGTVLSTAINNDNAKGIQLYFSLASGPDDLENKTTWASGGLEGFTGQDNFFDHTSNEFYLTGVQLELGSNATPFEHRSYGEELARCQRYYQLHQCGGSGVWNSTTRFLCAVSLPVSMRVTPTIGTLSGGLSNINIENVDTYNISAISAYHPSDQVYMNTNLGQVVDVSSGSGRTTGHGGLVLMDQNGDAFTYRSEL